MGDDPELTPLEFERLCTELADLDRKASLTDVRRKQIETLLRRTISTHREEQGTTEIKEHRLRLRLQRKAAREEGELTRKEQRAEILSRLSPEARAKLKASIAGLKECTKEELRQEVIDEQIKKKQDRAASRRWRNGNGSGGEAHWNDASEEESMLSRQEEQAERRASSGEEFDARKQQEGCSDDRT